MGCSGGVCEYARGIGAEDVKGTTRTVGAEFVVLQVGGQRSVVNK